MHHRIKFKGTRVYFSPQCVNIFIAHTCLFPFSVMSIFLSFQVSFVMILYALALSALSLAVHPGKSPLSSAINALNFIHYLR